MKKKTYINLLILFVVVSQIFVTACGKDNTSEPETEGVQNDTTTQDTIQSDTTVNDTLNIPDRAFYTGFRYSNYGPDYDPGKAYWWNIGVRIANDFGNNATPASVWILGTLQSNGVYLNFPVTTSADYIACSSVDKNEEIFCRFDTLGYKIWLQVEPGWANIDTLINLVLSRYSHHKCIKGFGVDVEWHKSDNPDSGVAITDEMATRWVAAVRQFNPDYKIFFKHWLINKMPPTARDGIVFIDDSQMFEKMEDMISEFKKWGEAFAPAKVGFQYGYSYDRRWWGSFENPNLTIGAEILNKIPNADELYWVDFTLLDVYPPE
jgi:hypothetical protein